MKIMRVLARYSIASAFLIASALQAGSIGPNCGSCFGGVYTVDATQLADSSQTTDTWRITYSLNLSQYTGWPIDFVRSLAAQVVSAADFISAGPVFTAPTSGPWTMTSGNVSNSQGGCSGNTSNGWVCLEYDGSILDWNALRVGTNNTYSWIFDVNVRQNSFRGLVNIQANFDPAIGRFMSESVSVSVPEGNVSELPMLLGGILLLAAWQMRKWLPLSSRS